MEYFAFQWHITDSCDQRCEHCYIFSEGHPKLVEMSFERAAEATFASDLGRKLMSEAGIADGYIARVCLCLGYPDGEPGPAKPRKEGRIKIVG